jgi:hypothetical protein
MPSKEIKELRKVGRLYEALDMALAEMQEDPDNIWTKRNISWVYYEYLKQNCSAGGYGEFVKFLKKVSELDLPEDEKMLFDSLAFQIGKMIFALLKEYPVNNNRIKELFDISRRLHFSRTSESFSFLFKGFHKGFKLSENYIAFADWWDFNNFREEDFNKEELPNGKEVMAIAEQGYIAYSKHLLKGESAPEDNNVENFQSHIANHLINDPFNFIVGDIELPNNKYLQKDKIKLFLQNLEGIIVSYPHLEYLIYYKAKLLLALNEQQEVLKTIIPFAKKRRNDFWVWDLISEAHLNDEEICLACYCKALKSSAPEEMLMGVRKKLTFLLVNRQLFNEAKTEINQLLRVIKSQEFKVPNHINKWISEKWFLEATDLGINDALYNKHYIIAENLLFNDIEEEPIIVEYINKSKRIIHFFNKDSQSGYFKYDRFLKDPKIGDVLQVRFQQFSTNQPSKLFTVRSSENETFRNRFVIPIEGTVKIPAGKLYGFINNVYIHPSTIVKKKLIDGSIAKGFAVKTFNSEKNQWGWKFLEKK